MLIIKSVKTISDAVELLVNKFEDLKKKELKNTGGYSLNENIPQDLL